MSERMTDLGFETEASTLCAADVPWAKFAHFMGREARRARTSEVEKDATIKVLADALASVRDGFAPAARPGTAFGLMGQNIMDKVDFALRLAGRLP